MVTRGFIIVSFSIIIVLQSCLQCTTGGKLNIKQNYVANVCGLVNGVYIREIKVDSFKNNIPTKYSTVRSALLNRHGASPNNNPKKLYYDKDCKETYLWNNEVIIDTIKTPITFKNENWYIFYSMDAHTEVFMFVDKSGKRRFHEVSGKSELTNF